MKRSVSSVPTFDSMLIPRKLSDASWRRASLEDVNSLKLTDNSLMYSECGITCQASCDIQGEYQDGSVKSVHHYHGDFPAPEALKHLENKLDELIETASYIGDGSAKDL